MEAHKTIDSNLNNEDVEQHDETSLPQDNRKDPLVSWKPTKEITTKDLIGTCGCTKIELFVPQGSIVKLSGYCHCISCRKMTGCPFQSDFAIPVEQLSFPMDDTNDLGFTQITVDGPKRFFCKKCSTYLYSYVKGMELFFISHSSFNAFEEVPPTFHCNYGEKVIRIKDDLVKYNNFPPLYPGMSFDLVED